MSDKIYDIHSHIIWNVDDGSANLEISKEMLRQASKCGTTHIVATPHVIDLHNMPDWEKITDSVRQLKEFAREENLGLTVFSGAEVYLNWELLDRFKDNKRYCINNGPYMLVEFPMEQIPNYVDDFFFELRVRGIKPILAHPERYMALRHHFDRLIKWRMQGLLLQINIESLLGKYGQEAKNSAEAFLKSHVVDFIGSDAHNIDRRTTDISEALEVMEKLVPREEFVKIVRDNPNKMVFGEEIHIVIPEKIVFPSKQLSLYERMKKFILG